MLELAIAEAYRQRAPRPTPSSTPPRPASFVTNASARAALFSFRPRPTSSLSSNPSATSQPRSLRRFVSRRARPSSKISTSLEGSYTHRRKDSVATSNTVTAELSTPQGVPPAVQPRLILPCIVPLPPQDDLITFDNVLEAAIDDLQANLAVETHDCVTTTLSHLAHVADVAACVATTWPEFWSMLVHAAQLLCSVSSTSHAYVKNVIARALERVAERWNEEQGRSKLCSTAELARVAGGTLDEEVRQRRRLGEKLGGVFARWLKEDYDKLWKVDSCAPSVEGAGNGSGSGASEPTTNQRQEKVLRILMSVPSSAILSTLTHALSAIPSLSIQLSVLDASDITSLLESDTLQISNPRLKLSMFLPQAVGTASQGIDILLLDPHCINSQGNVLDTTGALGTTVCVKAMSPHAKVVVLGDTGNILPSFGTVKRGYENSENIEELSCPSTKSLGESVNTGTPLENVPARFLDVYLAETGMLKPAEVSTLAIKAGERERYILGEP